MPTTTSPYTIDETLTGWQIRRGAELYDYVYYRHADAVQAERDFERQDAEGGSEADVWDALESLRDEVREDVAGVLGLIDGLDDPAALRRVQAALRAL